MFLMIRFSFKRKELNKHMFAVFNFAITLTGTDSLCFYT